MTGVEVDEISPLDFSVFEARSDRLGGQGDAPLGTFGDPMTSADALFDAELRGRKLVEIPGGERRNLHRLDTRDRDGHPGSPRALDADLVLAFRDDDRVERQRRDRIATRDLRRRLADDVIGEIGLRDVLDVEDELVVRTLGRETQTRALDRTFSYLQYLATFVDAKQQLA